MVTLTTVAGALQADVHVSVNGGRVASIRVGSSPRTLYLHRDRLTSVVGTTLAGGVRGATYLYGPHGALVAATGDASDAASELGYAGTLRLTGGLLLMGARIYDPNLKVFLQPDPLAPHSYTYAGGDPINRWDPTGLEDKPAKRCNGGECPPPGGGDGTQPGPVQPGRDGPYVEWPPITVKVPKPDTDNKGSDAIDWDTWTYYAGVPGYGGPKESGGKGAGTNGWFERGVNRIRNDGQIPTKLLVSASAIILGLDAAEIGFGLLTAGVASLPTPLAWVAPIVLPLGITFLMVGLGSMAGGAAYGFATLNEAFTHGRRRRKPLTGTNSFRRRRGRFHSTGAMRSIVGGRP